MQESTKQSTMNTSDLCSNPSYNSITDEEWALPQGYKIYANITAAFVLIYIILGLPWNSLVVITILWKKLYCQPTILLLLNLVLNDILMLLFPLPVVELTGLKGHFDVGLSDATRCQVCRAGFVVIVLMMNSLFIVALLSIDRFFYIYKPFVYDEKANKRSTIVVIFTIMIVLFSFSLALGLLSLVPPGEMHFQPILLSCTISFKRGWYMTLLIITACIALITILICNAWVVRIVARNIKMIYMSNPSTDNDKGTEGKDQSLYSNFKKTRHKKQLHLFRVFGGLISANFITWLPLIILVIVCFFVDIMDIHPAVVTIIQILFLSQIVVHPILETILISDVREPMKQIATCGLLKTKMHTYTEEESGVSNCCFLFKIIEYSLMLHDNSIQTTSSNASNSV